MLHISEYEKERNITLNSLIKNNSFFKSEKQAKFLSKNLYNKEAQQWFSEKLALEMFPEAEYAVSISGVFSWADYGSRSKIPVTFVYALDKLGVVAKIKIPYNGNLKIGAHPDVSRASVMFERSKDVVVPEYLKFEEKENVQEETHHLGQVGDRLKVTARVVYVNHYESNFKTHYGDSGLRTIVTLKTDEGHILTHFGTNLAGYEIGKKISFICSIKEHSMYEGKKKTIITRPSKIAINTNLES